MLTEHLLHVTCMRLLVIAVDRTDSVSALGKLTLPGAGEVRMETE